jgi:hypothetical protein
MRDARVRVRPQQGAMGFVVLDVLALASQPIRFFGAACLLARPLLLGMNTPVLGTVGSLTHPFLQSGNGK